MSSFGKRMAEVRKERRMSQRELATQLATSVSVISRYERDEITPSIEAAKKVAALLTTTVAYLLGETEETDLFKDPEMLRRFKEISNLPQEDKHCILYNIDAILRDVKARQAYA